MSAELNIQLRLLLDQVQGDAAKAAAIIKQQLGSALGGGGQSPMAAASKDTAEIARSMASGAKATSKMVSDLDKISSTGAGINKSAAQWLKNASPAFLKNNPELAARMSSAQGAMTEPVGGGSGRIRINLDEQRKKAQAKSDKDMVTFKKDMSFLAMPLFNPGSMWATLFSTRQTYSAMNTEHGAAFRNSKLGGMGAGAATALLVGGATAAGLVLKVLTKTVQETIAAYEKARQLYAKSLMSGLGVELTTKRGMLASIMGVSEEDVLKFGAAMSYLNPKIEWASGVLARTTPELTRVAWEFDVLKVNLQAMFSLLASEGATSLTNFIAGLSVLVKLLSDSWITRMGAGAISGIASAAGGAMTGGSGLGQLLAKLGFKGIPEIGKLSGAGGNMPTPQSWMKQMPASSWEKMGLVIGNTHSNYAAETAKNTSETAKAVKAMAAHMGIGRGKGTSIYSPAFAMP